MDCSEVRDIIDAYALGASAPEETAEIESHVAECVRCWDELGRAQRTASLLALSVPMKGVPEGLEGRIMAIAREEAALDKRSERQPILQRLRLSWASAAAGLGVASIAALAFAGVLQAQVNDLRSENDRMESQIQGTTQELEGRVRDASDAADNASALLVSLAKTSRPGVEMKMSGEPQPASVLYTWSEDSEEGLVICENLEDAPEGMVYQVWLWADTVGALAASFEPEDGYCLLPVDLTALAVAPTGVGLTLLESGGASDLPDSWLAYAHFPAAE